MIRAPKAWPQGTGNAANWHRQISGRANYLNCHPAAELLGSFEEDLRFLTATELHPALRREGCRRLVDLVNAEQLRELWAGCSRSHRHFATKVRAWGGVVWKWLVAGGEGGWEGEGLGPHRPSERVVGRLRRHRKGQVLLRAEDPHGWSIESSWWHGRRGQLLPITAPTPPHLTPPHPATHHPLPPLATLAAPAPSAHRCRSWRACLGCSRMTWSSCSCRRPAWTWRTCQRGSPRRMPIAASRCGASTAVRRFGS